MPVSIYSIKADFDHMSQKTYTPEQRYNLVRKVLAVRDQLDCSLDEACETVGVPRTTFSRWRDKLLANAGYLQEEEEQIPDDSRTPTTFGRKTSEVVRQRVIVEGRKTEHTSANSITRQLNAEGITIGTTKVIEILEEEGLYGMIQVRSTEGGFKRKRGLLRLCQKRQQGLRIKET